MTRLRPDSLDQDEREREDRRRDADPEEQLPAPAQRVAERPPTGAKTIVLKCSAVASMLTANGEPFRSTTTSAVPSIPPPAARVAPVN